MSGTKTRAIKVEPYPVLDGAHVIRRGVKCTECGDVFIGESNTADDAYDKACDQVRIHICKKTNEQKS